MLKETRDLEVLYKCRMLQKKKLSEADAELVKLILSQLENDWRKSLLAMINKVIRKY